MTIKRFDCLALLAVLSGLNCARAGNIIISGHDDDVHAVNNNSAQSYGQLQALAAFAGKSAPSPALPILILAVAGGHLDTALTTLGIAHVVFDPTSAVPGPENFDVAKYSAVGVASYVGVVEGEISDAAIANIVLAKSSITQFINHGGGLFMLAGANSPSYYNVLPKAVRSLGSPDVKSDSIFTQTSFGATIGIPVVTASAAHNYFGDPTLPSSGVDPAWNVVETYTGLVFAGTSGTPTSVTTVPITLAIEGGVVCSASGISISKVTPNFAVSGSGDLSLLLSGAGFTSDPSIQVQWTDAIGTTELFTPDASGTTATQLSVKISGSRFSSPGTALVVVTACQTTSAPVTSDPPQPFFVLAAPTISTLSPNSAVAGSGNLLSTIVGTGFAARATVNWIDSAGKTTVLMPLTIAPTQITVTVPFTLLAFMGTAQVSVTVPQGDSPPLTSNSPLFSILAPPTITSLAPPSAVAGSGNVQLAILGTGFSAGASVMWTDATKKTTTLTPSTSAPGRVIVTIPSTLLATAGMAQVSVAVTPLEGTTITSNRVAFSIFAAPTITSLSPNSAIVGVATLTLKVVGTDFAPGSTVSWIDSTGKVTTLTPVALNATQITVTLPATLLASPSTVEVSVSVPQSTGPRLISNQSPFSVLAAPTITNLNPVSSFAGSGNLPLTILGTGFAAGATVVWTDLTGRVTLLKASTVSASQITVSIPNSLLSNPGPVQISVSIPQGDGSTLASSPSPFTILPVPTLTGVVPNNLIAGSGSRSINISGSGFPLTGTAVIWTDSSGRTTTLAPSSVTSGQVTVTIPSGLLTTASNAQVSVSVLGGDGTSFSIGQTLFSILPVPSIASLEPPSTIAGSGATPLTIVGVGFPLASSVVWTDTTGRTTPLAPFTVSSTQIKVLVPASLVATAGQATVSVAFLGGSYSPAIFVILSPPLITLTPTAVSTQGQTSVNVIVATAPTSDYVATFGLKFTTTADNTPPSYIDPKLQFSTGPTIDVTLPAGGTVSVPPLPLQTGTTAGTITVQLVKLRLSSAPATDPGFLIVNPSTATISVPRSAPAISGTPTSTISGGTLTVDFNATAATRSVTQATITFSAAADADLTGTTFTIDLTAPGTAWFKSTDGLNSGGTFHVSLPFTYTGDPTAVASVSVMLASVP